MLIASRFSYALLSLSMVGSFAVEALAAPPAAEKAAPTSPSRRDPDDPRPLSYTVKKGDTLYSIAFDFGLPYAELADWNDIENPDIISIGQVLKLVSPAKMPPIVPTGRLPSAPIKSAPLAPRLPYSVEALKQLRQNKGMLHPSAATVAMPIKPDTKPDVTPTKPPKPTPSVTPPVATEPAAETPPVSTPSSTSGSTLGGWEWPVSGKIIAKFGQEGNKGIDIAGKKGTPILASLGGKVVYSGSGLRGYGKLVILKHDKIHLSAYAHNSRLWVKEGDMVKKGQRIAEMGDTDADQPKLHFEVRRYGKPVDPLAHLPAR